MHYFPVLAEATVGGVRVDRLSLALILLSAAVLVMLSVLVLTYCIRYRAGSSADRSSIPVRSTWLELTCLTVTLLTFLAIGVWANAEFVRARTAPPDAYSVYVSGKQWTWKLEHPSGRREIDELHVPVGEPVRLVLSSADVIHSFAIPDFRVKQDVVPGRYTSLWFTATAPGEHRLFCSQYCGAEHSAMTGRIIAMPAAEFSRWLSDRPLEEKTPGSPGTPAAPLTRGKALFYHLGCSACHVQTGNVLAPRLDGIWGRPTRLANGREIIVDENYIRESILDPNARIVAGYGAPSLMPSFAGAVSDDDVMELVEFIRSIRFGWPDDSPSSTPAAPTPSPRDPIGGKP